MQLLAIEVHLHVHVHTRNEITLSHCIIIIIIIINDIIKVHKYYWSTKCINKNHNVNTIATFHTTTPRK